MNKVRTVLLCALLGIVSLTLAACAPTPEDEQIKAAVYDSLAGESLPPELVFEDMQIPARDAGRANAVLWTEDKEIQRNYSLEYDKAKKSFIVSAFTTSRRSEEGTYYAIPNDLTLRFSEYSKHFDFSSDFDQKYLLLYVGQGDKLSELREEYEKAGFGSLGKQEVSAFEECDLGGDTLVLLVPRYEGTKVWVNEVAHKGDRMEQGPELARFGDDPVYIMCDYDDDLPEYEIHISVGNRDEFFLTRQELIKRISDD